MGINGLDVSSDRDLKHQLSVAPLENSGRDVDAKVVCKQEESMRKIYVPGARKRRQKLIEDILEGLIHRSICSVQVSSMLVTEAGEISSIGWNSVGAGFGLHAEAHCIGRANPKRLRGSTIYIAARRLRNGKTVTSKPCPECQQLLDAFNIKAIYRDGSGVWVG